MFKLIRQFNNYQVINNYIFRSTQLNSKYIITEINTQKLVSNLVNYKMAPKKSNNKRKVNELANSPATKIDPFTAAKKSKKNQDIIKINNVTESNDLVELNSEEIESKEICDKTNTNKIQPKISALFTPVSKNEKKNVNVKKGSKKENDKNNDDEETDDNQDEGVNQEVKPKEPLKYNSDDFKKPSNGKEYNFKMVTFNVNGIRACIEHGLMEYIKAEDADIVCVQETKCDKSKIPTSAELPNYFTYWLSGDTQGYSGVGLYTKIKPIKVTYELDSKKHNNEGRIIIAEYEKFILVNSYIPNSARGLKRLPYRMEWEVEFRKKLAELEKIKPIIWCGDLNVAHNEIDLYNPEKSKKSAGFTNEERECFNNLLSDGYFDSYRYLYPNAKDVYTWWSYMRNARQKNLGWRIDYFVLSNKLKEYLVDNVIRSKVNGSDHCPVVLYLKF